MFQSLAELDIMLHSPQQRLGMDTYDDEFQPPATISHRIIHFVPSNELDLEVYPAPNPSPANPDGFKPSRRVDDGVRTRSRGKGQVVLRFLSEPSMSCNLSVWQSTRQV